MSHLHRHIFALALTVVLGGACSTFSQPLPGGTGFSRPAPASNPAVDPKYINYGHSSNRATKISAEEKNRHAVEQAIKEGNDARQRFDYEMALSSYRRAVALAPEDARSYYGLGNVYHDVYCYQSAIDSYSQAVRRKGDFLEALLQLGNNYALNERYDEAATQFEAALKVDWKSIDARLGRLYIIAKKGKPQEAIDGINRIISDKSIRAKDQAAAYLALGSVYVDQRKWQESLVPYEKATQLNPDLADAYIRLGISQFVSATLKAPRANRDTTILDKESLTSAARQASDNIRTAIYVKHYDHPNGYLILAMALSYQANYQDALNKTNAYLTRVKELENRLLGLDSRLGERCDYAFSRLYADGYYYLGSIYERQASDDAPDKDDLLNQAIEQFKKAITVKQDYAGAYEGLGTIYLGQQQYENAIAQYKRALIYETSLSMKGTLYGGIGSAYAKTGPDTEAVFYLNKAIELNPNDASNYLSLSQVYQNQGNFDEALRLLAKVRDLDTQRRASTYYLLASTYFSRARAKGTAADFEEAIKLVKTSIEIKSNYAEAYLLLGKIYQIYRDGANIDEAIANYEQAVKYDPKNAAIYFSLGDLHASVSHNYDAAIKYLNDAIRLKPEYPLAYWTLGIVYRQKNEDAEAIKQFLAGLRYQKDPGVYMLLADTYDRQKNYDEAIKWLQEAVRSEPTSSSPYLNLARTFTHQRKNEEAIHYYEEAIKRLKSNESANKNLYVCRIVRLQAQYTDALACFRNLDYPARDQVPYEVGVTYVLSGDKKAAFLQHQQLLRLNSPLAEDLLKQINEMK